MLNFHDEDQIYLPLQNILYNLSCTYGENESGFVHSTLALFQQLHISREELVHIWKETITKCKADSMKRNVLPGCVAVKVLWPVAL